jgi:hypothetical protein
MQNLNLAGLATLAMLILFFPTVGLFAVRRRRTEARKLYDEAHLRKLIREVAERDEQRQREETYR